MSDLWVFEFESAPRRRTSFRNIVPLSQHWFRKRSMMTSSCQGQNLGQIITVDVTTANLSHVVCNADVICFISIAMLQRCSTMKGCIGKILPKNRGDMLSCYFSRWILLLDSGQDMFLEDSQISVLTFAAVKSVSRQHDLRVMIILDEYSMPRWFCCSDSLHGYLSKLNCQVLEYLHSKKASNFNHEIMLSNDAATALPPAIPESPMDFRPQKPHYKVWNCLPLTQNQQSFPFAS